MRRTGWKMLLAVSLCLNAGFLAAFGIQHLRHGPGHGRGHGMGNLKLPPATQARFDTSYAEFRARLAPLQAERRAERARLVDLLASADPAPEAVRAQEGRVLDVDARILAAQSDHLLKQKALLTAQERQLFFDHIRRRNPGSEHRTPGKAEEKRP